MRISLLVDFELSIAGLRRFNYCGINSSGGFI
jgi:hypothetical protein